MTAIIDLYLRQGKTLDENIQCLKRPNPRTVDGDPEPQPFDLLGYQARGWVKSARGGTTLATFAVLVADSDEGILNFILLPSATDSVDPGTYFWELEIYSGAAIEMTVAEGVFYLL